PPFKSNTGIFLIIDVTLKYSIIKKVFKILKNEKNNRRKIKLKIIFSLILKIKIMINLGRV
ncbi:MAG: hypothetical protein IJ104_06845, partial [Methanobrevibacter sp.]|nr:hypothetical protein [Methanobrevibacter sp.]